MNVQTFEQIKELYFKGENISAIHSIVGCRVDELFIAINELKNTYKNSDAESKISQIRCIETELFNRIEAENKSKIKDKTIDSLQKVYSTFLVC